MVTKNGEWVKEAIEILKPVIQGADLTAEYLDVEKEAMRNIMENIRELQEHLDGELPEKECPCNSKSCPGWQLGYDKCNHDRGE